MSAMTSNDPNFNELLRAMGAPDNLTSFELLAAVGDVVRVRCAYLAPALEMDSAGRRQELVANFELVRREDMALLRKIRKALAALDNTARELQPDGMGFIAIGRMQDHFAGEIAAARKAEGLSP